MEGEKVEEREVEVWDIIFERSLEASGVMLNSVGVSESLEVVLSLVVVSPVRFLL